MTAKQQDPASTSHASNIDALIDALTSRIEALEIKASFNEDALEQLDQVIIRQQEQIDLLIKAVTDLRQSQNTSTAPAERNLRDELPPHF